MHTVNLSATRMAPPIQNLSPASGVVQRQEDDREVRVALDMRNKTHGQSGELHLGPMAACCQCRLACLEFQ